MTTDGESLETERSGFEQVDDFFQRIGEAGADGHEEMLAMLIDAEIIDEKFADRVREVIARRNNDSTES